MQLERKATRPYNALDDKKWQWRGNVSFVAWLTHTCVLTHTPSPLNLPMSLSLSVSLIQALQTKTTADAKAILSKADSIVESLEATYGKVFALDKPSEIEKAFRDSDSLALNTTVATAVTASQDAIAQALTDFCTLRNFITLSIPQMEDGNNFGVTVQLEALKQLKEGAEELQKSIDELTKYFAARADAMDKLNLPSESQSETKKEETDSDGATKTTSSKEWKKSEGKASEYRTQAVYAVDIQYYGAAKKAFRAVQAAYYGSLDFVLKNKDKIEAPKGTGGSSGFSSMY